MALRLITAPTVEPVTLAEAKLRLRIDSDASDDDLWSLLVSARQEIDGQNGWLGRAILTQEWELSLAGWPSRGIRLPLPPTQSVVSIDYQGVDGTPVVWPVENYRFIDGGNFPSWVELAPDAAWPALGVGPDPIAIRFTAGWATPEQVPLPIRTWIIARAGGMYAQPEGLVVAVTTTTVGYYQDMLASYRIWC